MAFCDRALVEGGDGDLGEALPGPDEVEAVGDGIADVEGLDAAVEQVGDEAVQGGFGELGRVAAHDEDGLELGLAAEEGVEEVAEPGDGEEGGGGERGGGERWGGRGGGLLEEVGEAVGDVFLEEVQVLQLLLVVVVHGDHLVAADADAVEERTLVVRRRHN